MGFFQTYQENDRNVEHESNHGVCKQSEIANVLNVKHRHLGHLDNQSDNAVHNGARRGKVVQRDQWVHLELGGREKALNHVQTDGLESDTTELEEHTSDDKFDFTSRSNNDTDNNDGDIAESPVIWW